MYEPNSRHYHSKMGGKSNFLDVTSFLYNKILLSEVQNSVPLSGIRVFVLPNKQSMSNKQINNDDTITFEVI